MNDLAELVALVGRDEMLLSRLTAIRAHKAEARLYLLGPECDAGLGRSWPHRLGAREQATLDQLRLDRAAARVFLDRAMPGDFPHE